MTETKRAVGRPSSYKPEFCAAIMENAELIALGGTNEAIAKALDVDRATVVRWAGEHKEFAAACQAVKDRVDDRVEASLFKRGIGYSHKAVKIFMPAGAAEPVYADYTEHYPPDTAAASLWLRNRRPKEWRDRVEHTGADGGPVQVAGVTDVLEAARLIAFALETAARTVRTPGDGAKVIEGSVVADDGARDGETEK